MLVLGHPLTDALQPTLVAIIDGSGRVCTVVLAEIRWGLLEQAGIETLAQPGLGERAEDRRTDAAHRAERRRDRVQPSVRIVVGQDLRGAGPPAAADLHPPRGFASMLRT